MPARAQLPAAEQAHTPYADERPVQLQLRVRGPAAAQRAAPAGLLKVRKNPSNPQARRRSSPWRSLQRALGKSVTDTPAAFPRRRLQEKHQRRLALERRLVEPQVDHLRVLARPAELAHQPHVGSHAAHEVVVGGEERLPKVVADKAGIGHQQRLGRQLGRQRHELVALTGT